VPLALYRVWGDDPRAIAEAARALPYAQGARAAGRCAHVTVWTGRAPEAARIAADLAGLGAGGVRLVEPAPLDMESILLAFAQGLAA
jgi:hypothetical protein